MPPVPIEDFKNLGAMSANTQYVFDLTNPDTFAEAARAVIHRIEFVNSSGANWSIRVNGRQGRVVRGAPAIVEVRGRIREFVVTPDAAVSSGEGQVIAKGFAGQVWDVTARR